MKKNRDEMLDDLIKEFERLSIATEILIDLILEEEDEKCQAIEIPASCYAPLTLFDDMTIQNEGHHPHGQELCP